MAISKKNTFWLSFGAVIIPVLLAGIYLRVSDNKISFYVAGHAYGSHFLDNQALHEPLLEFFESRIFPVKTILFLTGDFLRNCSCRSWLVLEQQLAEHKLNTFMVAGNHESSEDCRKYISERHNATTYSLTLNKIPFIMLDTADKNHKVSDEQINLISSVIKEHKRSKYVFIMTHHLLWLSDSRRYPDIPANRGSRWINMQNSNYWSDLHPLLTQYKDKEFYFLAGDVGGNPDAIPAFYDKVDNVTFIASGMGEVPDENVLKVTLENNMPPKFQFVPIGKESSVGRLNKILENKP